MPFEPKLIIHFADLSDEMKTALLEYIDLNFTKRSSFNHKHTAYGLKHHFTSTYKPMSDHVTSECFAEAMVAAGFKRKLIEESNTPGASNWIFNANVPKRPKP